MYRKLLELYDFNRCSNTSALRVVHGLQETRPQKAAVQFLSEMARSASCSWTILVVLHSVSPVSSWAILLSIHSCLLDFLF